MVVTVLCVTTIAITVAALASPSFRDRLGLGSKEPPAYPRGSQIDLPEDLYSASDLTLFIFIRHDCSACQAAKPAFARIATQLAGASVPVRLVGSSSAEEANATYLAELSLARSQLVSTSLNGHRIHSVPTAVLVDRTGAVRYSFEGAPTAAQERELTALAFARQAVK